MDYSAFAPARPPQAGYSHGAGSASDGGRAGAQDAPGRSYGPAGLAGHFDSLDLSDPHSFDAFHPPNSSSSAPSSSNARAPLTLSRPPGPMQAGPSYQPTLGLPNGYSAANRPRPQLSPGLSPSGGVFPPRSTSPLPHPGANGSNAPRVPRKSSLPPIPGQGAPSSGPAPPLPPLPPSASSSSSQLEVDSFGLRDSSGGEQVFNGAAIAAGTDDDTSRTNLPAGHAAAASASTASGNAALAASSSLKRANPLEDLIATETAYVEDLGAVIKRVAAAWSRDNFPPPALDAMFRAIEAVYRINKTLLEKLHEIGPNPSSPKALGDLLMRWISDIEPAYTRYATTISFDFDIYEPVQSNPKLAPILASLPWPPSLPSPPSPLTMDRLFELPYYRVRYYKRLYAKLLRSTQEGRSDHALLVSANEKLAKLEEMCEEGRKRSVLGPGGKEEVMRRRVEEDERWARQAQGQAQVADAPAQPPVLEQRIPAEYVERLASPPVERREVEQPGRAGPPRLNLDLSAAATTLRKGEQRSAMDSPRMESPSSSSSFRSSGATGISTANTSAVHAPSPNPSREPPLRVSELERRLNTERTLDIFTMKPRKCKLQMQPPNLVYQRQLRKASEAVMSFVPTSDPAERPVRIPRAFVIILTDLFLICEYVAPEELHVAGGADLWLLYPPLAGKHLRVVEGPNRGEIEVTIMNKERLTFHVEGGDEVRAKELKAAIEEAARFGATQPRQDSTMSSGAGHSPISPTSPNSALSSSFGPMPGQSLPPPPPNAHPASPIPPSPLSATSRSDERSVFPHPGPPPLGAVRPPPHHQRNPPPFDPSRRAVSGPAPSVARPERNASMTQRGYPAPSPTYANGQVVQSPVSSDFRHTNGSQGHPPHHRDPYGQPDYRQPGTYSTGSGRQSPHSPQGSFPQSDFGQYAPPHANGAYPTYPNGMPRSQSDLAPPIMAGMPPRPDSRQSNGSYSSGRTDNSGRWPAAPPPLPKERSFNGMDFSGRGGPLYATSLRSEQGQGGFLAAPQGPVHRSRSADGLRSDALRGAMNPSPNYRAPSQALIEERSTSAPGSSRSASKLSSRHHDDVSPPTSPVEPRIPDKTSVVATMRCKVFLQQHHAQWKSLGTAKLKLFQSMPSNTKQLVVDSDKGGGKTIISTIVLANGVERVGKTGVAIDLSDQGQRTGIIYMLQLRTEQSATGLFEQLLLGTDRAGR